MDDGDRAIHFCCFSAVRRVGREDTVGEGPDPVALGLIADDRRVHGDATERDVGVGSEIVEPRRVLLGTGLRGDDRDAVGDVDSTGWVGYRDKGLLLPSYAKLADGYRRFLGLPAAVGGGIGVLVGFGFRGWRPWTGRGWVGLGPCGGGTALSFSRQRSEPMPRKRWGSRPTLGGAWPGSTVPSLWLTIFLGVFDLV